MNMWDMPLPEPSIEAAQRILPVLTAFRMKRGGIREQWEWIRILEAAAVGGQFTIRSQTRFFTDILCDNYDKETSKKVYDLIKSHIIMSPSAEKRVLEALAGVDASEEPKVKESW